MTGFTTDFAAGIPSWGATAAYGPTAVINGIEVIPVALVVFGFGAGELDKAASVGHQPRAGVAAGALVSGIAVVGAARSSIILVSRGVRSRVVR